MNNESQIQKDHPVKLRSFDTHSHSLREDGQGPPKSERLSILTPFPNQALFEVLKVPSALTSSEHSFGKTYRGPAAQRLLDSTKETPKPVKTDRTDCNILKVGIFVWT